jgi:hypothetical protein
MDDRYVPFFGWAVLWIVLLNLPPGSTQIPSLYRLNFVHGVLSSVVAILCMQGHLTESVTTTCTLSYFLVDFANIILNDWFWKVKGYQNPQNRKVEYFHHVFCFTLGALSEFRYKEYCPSYSSNPFVPLMFAEFSTPFLMIWRALAGTPVEGRPPPSPAVIQGLYFAFIVTFFACRILYHGLYLVPEFFRRCHPGIGYGFGVPYNLMNFYFFAMVCRRLWIDTKRRKSKSKDGNDDDDKAAAGTHNKSS